MNMFKTLTTRLFGALIDTIKAERSSTYLQKKFDDHRWYTAAFIFMLIPIGAADWMFDYQISPLSADKTLWYRILFIWMLIPAFVIARTRQYKMAAILIMLTGAAAILHTLAILNALDGSMSHIMGGFMIIPFLTVLLGIGFSIKINFLMLAFAIIVPLLLVAAGWLDGFSQQLYFLYMAQPV